MSFVLNKASSTRISTVSFLYYRYYGPASVTVSASCTCGKTVRYRGATLPRHVGICLRRSRNSERLEFLRGETLLGVETVGSKSLKSKSNPTRDNSTTHSLLYSQNSSKTQARPTESEHGTPRGRPQRTPPRIDTWYDSCYSLLIIRLNRTAHRIYQLNRTVSLRACK
jgi:hypothetical protein